MSTTTEQRLDTRAAAVLGDRIEAAAYADLYRGTPPALRARLGLAVETVAGATALVATALPVPMFNRVIGLGLGLDTPARAADVETLQRLYRGAGIANWWLHWNPFAAPADFVAQLSALGFTAPARQRWVKLLRSTAATPSTSETSLTIAPSTDSEVDATARAIVAAFEMPPFAADWVASVHGRARWRLYTARAGEAIAGGAALFVDGHACWLGIGGVLAAYRQRGGQTALIARRLADAGTAGVRWAVTETGEPVRDEANPSLANLRRSGFEAVASRLNFAAPAS